MLSDGKRFFYPLATPGAILRCEVRRDFPYPSTSLFRFVDKQHYEKSPCRIRDRFCKAMVFNHPFDLQILYCNIIKLSYDLIGGLMREVPTLIGYLLMLLCKLGGGFPAVLSPFVFLRYLALRYLQFRLRLFEKARVLYNFTGRKRGEVFYANINADRFACFWKRLRQGVFYCEDDKPSVNLFLDSTGFDFAFDLTRQSDSARTYTRECEFIASEFESRLWIGERVKTIFALESGVAGFVARFHAAKEILKGALEFLQCCLKYLRMYVCYVRSNSANLRQFSTLLRKTNRLVSLLLSIASFFQRSIVEFAASVKRSLTTSDEFLIRSYLELIRFQLIPCAFKKSSTARRISSATAKPVASDSFVSCSICHSVRW